jgi:hypothetical protein
MWRLIAITSGATLDDLVALILHSVTFDNDHLYKFTFRNRMGVSISISHPAMEPGPWTDQIFVGDLPFIVGQSSAVGGQAAHRVAGGAPYPTGGNVPSLSPIPRNPVPVHHPVAVGRLIRFVRNFGI